MQESKLEFLELSTIIIVMVNTVHSVKLCRDTREEVVVLGKVELKGVCGCRMCRRTR